MSSATHNSAFQVFSVPPPSMSKPAVYELRGSYLETLPAEVRHFVSEGVVSLKELASIINRDSGISLFLNFQSLMIGSTWAKIAVVCTVPFAPNNEPEMLVKSSSEFSEVDFDNGDDLFVPRGFSDTVLKLQRLGVTRTSCMESRNAAHFADGSSKGLLPHLSRPCSFTVVDQSKK